MLYENHKIKLLVPSILFLLLGIAFMVYPANSMIMLVRITGGFLILLGILIFIPTLRDRAFLGFRFGLLLALTIIIAVFGVILLVMPDAFLQVFWITLGIILILDGIKNLMFLSVLPFKIVNILLSVVSIICGVLILLHPFGTGMASMVLIGAFFAYSGAAGIALSILSKIKGRQAEATVTAEEAGAGHDFDEYDSDHVKRSAGALRSVDGEAVESDENGKDPYDGVDTGDADGEEEH